MTNKPPSGQALNSPRVRYRKEYMKISNNIPMKVKC